MNPIIMWCIKFFPITSRSPTHVDCGMWNITSQIHNHCVQVRPSDHRESVNSDRVRQATEPKRWIPMASSQLHRRSLDTVDHPHAHTQIAGGSIDSQEIGRRSGIMM